MKKTLALLMALALCFGICACGEAAVENTEPIVVLEPLTVFPEYSEDFQIVVDNIDVDQQALESLFGYAYAAFNAYAAEGFCGYVYEDLDFTVFQDTIDKINAANPDDAVLKVELAHVATELARIAANVAKCNVAYTGIKANQNDKSYEEVKEMMVSALNEYSHLVYGVNIIGKAVDGDSVSDIIDSFYLREDSAQRNQALAQNLDSYQLFTDAQIKELLTGYWIAVGTNTYGWWHMYQFRADGTRTHVGEFAGAGTNYMLSKSAQTDVWSCENGLLSFAPVDAKEPAAYQVRKLTEGYYILNIEGTDIPSYMLIQANEDGTVAYPYK